MDANNDELDVKKSEVEAEVTKGEQDDVLQKDYSQSKTEETWRTPPLKLSSKDMKNTQHDAPIKHDIGFASPRIKELARPLRNRVLNTLREKAAVLSPAFVHNLIRALKVETCLTPEQAAQTLQRKKRRKKKIVRFSPFATKLLKEITKLDKAHAGPLDRDSVMCQYLIAERFVKSILGWQCRTERKDIREIADAITNRLMSLEEYESTNNGSQATQQLRFLADVIACWIVEILVEVAETRREALQEYCNRRLMKRIEVEDADETDSEIEMWKQIEQREAEKRKKKEMYQKEGKDKEKIIQEKDKQKDEMKMASMEQKGIRSRDQVSEKEIKKKDIEEIEKEQKLEGNIKTEDNEKVGDEGEEAEKNPTDEEAG